MTRLTTSRSTGPATCTRAGGPPGPASAPRGPTSPNPAAARTGTCSSSRRTAPACGAPTSAALARMNADPWWSPPEATWSSPAGRARSPASPRRTRSCRRRRTGLSCAWTSTASACGAPTRQPSTTSRKVRTASCTSSATCPRSCRSRSRTHTSPTSPARSTRFTSCSRPPARWCGAPTTAAPTWTEGSPSRPTPPASTSACGCRRRAWPRRARTSPPSAGATT
jgi:hypothetical protein